MYLRNIHNESVIELNRLIDEIGNDIYESLCKYRKDLFLSGILRDRPDILYEADGWEINEQTGFPRRTEKKIYVAYSYMTKKCLHTDLIEEQSKLLKQKSLFRWLKSEKVAAHRMTLRTLPKDDIAHVRAIELLKLVKDGRITDIEFDILRKAEMDKIDEQYNPIVRKIQDYINSGIEGTDWKWELHNGSKISSRSPIHDYGYYDDKHDDVFTDEHLYKVPKYRCDTSLGLRNCDENHIFYRGSPTVHNVDYYPVVTVDGFITQNMEFVLDNRHKFGEGGRSSDQFPQLDKIPDFYSIVGYEYNTESKKYEKK